MCWLTGRRDVSNGRTGHPRKEEPCPLAHRVPPADLLHSEGPKPRDGQLARSRQSAMPPQPRMRGVFQHTTPSAKLRNRERGQPWILIFADPRQISPGSAGRVRHDRVGSRVLPRVALRIPAFHVRHGRVGPAGIDVQSGYAFHLSPQIGGPPGQPGGPARREPSSLSQDQSGAPPNGHHKPAARLERAGNLSEPRRAPALRAGSRALLRVRCGRFVDAPPTTRVLAAPGPFAPEESWSACDTPPTTRATH
jgi:hypothetical protein